MERKFTKFGQFMYNLTFKAAKFFNNHKFWYYVLIYTWGLPYSIIGLIVSLFLLICGFKPEWYYSTWYFAIGKGWGGASIGSNFLVGIDCNGTRSHELGHTYQVALLGIFFYVLVAIPSFIRYWYFTIKENQYAKQGKRYYYNYDAVWFEAGATDIGKFITKK